ncbi:MAG: hydroxymethylglutaryl-CoA reductase, degradative [Nitrososphaerota archaeon]|uniref:hydroxymethylglutaryl-CoA reductase, degradative n=1 Tax=Candidatus Bathycorpusculum sp. TaxID=2994959 RepID=UPI00281FE5BD|nr:hydroxymethylglutaryl-CoA reductase, degradative [Candidatus Termitimicrobium sp.]MCL2432384.1 hydroxymethylglutaryl-CoA reductase, degradative [Candidatus Termitimicrobium sp.]MDR0493176.1 hydroxymethylglutaryl-CoA reductase, degradative [Nitrososphaerota archaeon]
MTPRKLEHTMPIKECPMAKTSVLSGFYKLPPKERLALVAEFSGLTSEETLLLEQSSALSPEVGDHMVENFIGVFPEPLGVAVNFQINGKDYLIPMATEEPSVIAAASYAAKMVRDGGGFQTNSTPPVMIGQIQVAKLNDVDSAQTKVLTAKDELLKKANEQDPILNSYGGGAKDLATKIINTTMGSMLIVELYVDCRDAMGANAVNTMAEAIAPIIEDLTGGQVYLRIISNLATRRLVKAWCVVPKEALGGEAVVEGIAYASAFAEADPYRGATHNKGALNGIIAVILATGNDHRAIEAGAHAYAALNGKYTSLSRWIKNSNGDLEGVIELPMAVGLIGGAVKTHPIAKIAMKILGVKSANEFAEVLAAVGLAQNLGALRALASEGIQRGHMSLHARNIAVTAGAQGNQIDVVAEQMVRDRRIRVDYAKEILEGLNKKASS